jgi:hypothetical protein
MTPITTAEQFDRALSQASAGATLVLDPTFQYPAPVTFNIPLTITTSDALAVKRMTPGPLLPRFLGKVVFNNGGKAIGVEFRNANHFDNLVEAYGVWQFDRCRMLGDPIFGAHRGIAAFPLGNCRIVRCYMDDCFLPSPGQDAQAIAMWQGYGLTVTDNFLRAGSETVILGGADPTSEALIPSNVTISGNTITANPAWLGHPIGVKARLELKNCRNVLIERNEIRYCWAQGQEGVLVKLNVRNQDGTAPWSTIENVIIRNNQCANGSTAIGLLGTDYLHPSGRMTNVLIQGNHFDGLDPDKYQQGEAIGSDKLILLQGGPDNLTIDSNVFHSTRVSSQVYFDWSGDDRKQARNLVISNNQWPASTYGIFGTQGSANNLNNSVWNAFVESGMLSGNTEV